MLKSGGAVMDALVQVMDTAAMTLVLQCAFQQSDHDFVLDTQRAERHDTDSWQRPPVTRRGVEKGTVYPDGSSSEYAAFTYNPDGACAHEEGVPTALYPTRANTMRGLVVDIYSEFCQRLTCECMVSYVREEVRRVVRHEHPDAECEACDTMCSPALVGAVAIDALGQVHWSEANDPDAADLATLVANVDARGFWRILEIHASLRWPELVRVACTLRRVNRRVGLLTYSDADPPSVQ